MKLLHFAFLTGVLTMLGGCATTPGGRGDGPQEAPTYEQLAAAHNLRVSQLSRVQSRGVIEIRWRDADGVTRFRQGDVDLYIDLPRRTALRVTKLGKVYMWLGSDDERYWLFDLVDEPVLYTGLHDPLAAPQQNLHTVQPLALLDLIGLGRIAEFEPEGAPQVYYHEQRDAWRVDTYGGAGAVRIYFDRATRLPRRIETIGSDLRPAYYSDIHMNRYRSVPVPGISAATLPRLPTNVDILPAGPNADQDGFVKLALDSPTGRVDDGVFDRVFNFNRLMQSLRPQRIEGDLP